MSNNRIVSTNPATLIARGILPLASKVQNTAEEMHLKRRMVDMALSFDIGHWRYDNALLWALHEDDEDRMRGKVPARDGDLDRAAPVLRPLAVPAEEYK